MNHNADAPPRVAFSTLAFPAATLALAVSLGRRWGYAGVELRLIDGEFIDPSMSAGGRGPGQPSPAPHGRAARRRLRQPRPA
jgi:hypothetical protein